MGEVIVVVVLQVVVEAVLDVVAAVAVAVVAADGEEDDLFKWLKNYLRDLSLSIYKFMKLVL